MSKFFDCQIAAIDKQICQWLEFNNCYKLQHKPCPCFASEMTTREEKQFKKIIAHECTRFSVICQINKTFHKRELFTCKRLMENKGTLTPELVEEKPEKQKFLILYKGQF